MVNEHEMEILIIFDRPLAQLSECKDCIGTPSSFTEAKLGVTEEMFCFRSSALL